MAVKINITEIKGKMIGLDGKEVYDPRFEKFHKNLMGSMGGIKQDEKAGEKNEESKEK